MSEKTSHLIQVTYLDGEKQLSHNPSNTILETLEAAGIEVHYHCREGFCGACRSKLLSGSVSYTTDPLAFIDDDEILPCCCKPEQDIALKVE